MAPCLRHATSLVLVDMQPEKVVPRGLSSLLPESAHWDTEPLLLSWSALAMSLLWLRVLAPTAPPSQKISRERHTFSSLLFVVSHFLGL